MDDIIDDMKYDAKHSFEDAIIPIEQAYEKWGGRISLLGGIDVDFMCRSNPEQIRRRCQAMLAKTSNSGGYALGTGNSVPEYVPYENYLAMIDCVRGR
jgi:uroporphyrinogen decarboxylase